MPLDTTPSPPPRISRGEWSMSLKRRASLTPLMRRNARSSGRRSTNTTLKRRQSERPNTPLCSSRHLDTKSSTSVSDVFWVHTRISKGSGRRWTRRWYSSMRRPSCLSASATCSVCSTVTLSLLFGNRSLAFVSHSAGRTSPRWWAITRHKGSNITSALRTSSSSSSISFRGEGNEMSGNMLNGVWHALARTSRSSSTLPALAAASASASVARERNASAGRRTRISVRKALQSRDMSLISRAISDMYSMRSATFVPSKGITRLARSSRWLGCPAVAKSLKAASKTSSWSRRDVKSAITWRLPSVVPMGSTLLATVRETCICVMGLSISSARDSSSSASSSSTSAWAANAICAEISFRSSKLNVTLLSDGWGEEVVCS
eukprot:PhM_4_TR14640/c0_g1_i1/m.34005